MPKPNTTWILDLTQTSNPALRLGIQGLYRFLKHGEGSKEFPSVCQGDGISWELTDTAITLNIRDVDDLNRLILGRVGTMREGILVPPGYCAKSNNPLFLASVRAHQGILASLWAPGMRGARFTRSMSGVVPLMETSEGLFQLDKKDTPFSIPENVPRTKKDEKTLFRMDELIPIVAPDLFSTLIQEKTGRGLKVTSHVRDASPGGVKIFIPWEFESLKGKQNCSGLHHPQAVMWNGRGISVDLKNLLALLFSCYGNIYTWSSAGVLAIGLDTATFSEADALHRNFARGLAGNYKGEFGSLGNMHTHPRMVAFTVLHYLGAPQDRTYGLVYKEGKVSTLDDYTHQPSPPDSVWARLREAVLENLQVKTESYEEGEVENSALVYGLQKLPAQVFQDSKSTDGVKIHRGVYEIVLSNLEHHRPWYMGLSCIQSLWTHPRTYQEKGSGEKIECEGFTWKERAIVTSLFNRMANSMEQEIRRVISELRWKLLVKELKRRGVTTKTASNQIWSEARQRVHSEMVTQRLIKANTRPALLAALGWIISNAEGARLLTPEMYQEILNRAQTQPTVLRDLLIFALGVNDAKERKTSEVQPDVVVEENDPTDEPEENDDDSDDNDDNVDNVDNDP